MAKARTKTKKPVKKKATAKKPAKKPAKAKAKAKPKKVGRTQLDAAFAELNKNGIVALQDAGYTMSNGWEDANGEAHERREAGLDSKGACFYHRQDRERAEKGDGLHLAFGAYAEDKDHERASIALGQEIVEVLKKHGFKPRWDGTTTQRIHTGKFAWTKRPDDRRGDDDADYE